MGFILAIRGAERVGWARRDGVPDRRLLNRYARWLGTGGASVEPLAQAIHALLHAGGARDPFFLSHGLELLVKHLDASLATLVMVSGGAVDTRWWHPEGERSQPPAPIPSFCEWLLRHPGRILVVKDLKNGPLAPATAGSQALPFNAALGCALGHGDGDKTLLFAFFDRPRAFSRAEFALLEVVAGFIGRVIEIEDLKQSMNRLEDALAITQAVMEDSSTRDPETDLPNLRYLDIWQKAMLGSEHRPDSLVVAGCQMAVRNRKDVARIRKAAEGMRAGDLVVRMAPERFLVIFPHTSRSMAHILLLRLRGRLGGAPMGATLWVPGPEGLGLESCQTRLEAALEESRAMAQPVLVWRLPEEAGAGTPLWKARGAPQPWQPPTLQME